MEGTRDTSEPRVLIALAPEEKAAAERVFGLQLKRANDAVDTARSALELAQNNPGELIIGTPEFQLTVAEQAQADYEAAVAKRDDILKYYQMAESGNVTPEVKSALRPEGGAASTLRDWAQTVQYYTDVQNFLPKKEDGTPEFPEVRQSLAIKGVAAWAEAILIDTRTVLSYTGSDAAALGPNEAVAKVSEPTPIRDAVAFGNVALNVALPFSGIRVGFGRAVGEFGDAAEIAGTARLGERVLEPDSSGFTRVIEKAALRPVAEESSVRIPSPSPEVTANINRINAVTDDINRGLAQPAPEGSFPRLVVDNTKTISREPLAPAAEDVRVAVGENIRPGAETPASFVKEKPNLELVRGEPAGGPAPTPEPVPNNVSQLRAAESKPAVDTGAPTPAETSKGFFADARQKINDLYDRVFGATPESKPLNGEILPPAKVSEIPPKNEPVTIDLTATEVRPAAPETPPAAKVADAAPASETASAPKVAPPNSIGGNITGALDQRPPLTATVRGPEPAPRPAERPTVVLADEAQIDNPFMTAKPASERPSVVLAEEAQIDNPIASAVSDVANVPAVAETKTWWQSTREFFIGKSEPKPVPVVEDVVPLGDGAPSIGKNFEIPKPAEVAPTAPKVDASNPTLADVAINDLRGPASKFELNPASSVKPPIEPAAPPSLGERLAAWWRGDAKIASEVKSPAPPAPPAGGGGVPPGGTTPPPAAAATAPSAGWNAAKATGRFCTGGLIRFGVCAGVVGYAYSQLPSFSANPPDSGQQTNQKSPEDKNTPLPPKEKENNTPAPPDTTRRTLEGKPCGPNDTYGSSGCYPPYGTRTTAPPFVNAIPDPNGPILEGDYYCITSIQPVMVVPLAAGTRFPSNCYNNPTGGGSSNPFAQLGQMLGRLLNPPPAPGAPTSPTRPTTPPTPPSATSTPPKPIATLIADPVTILNGKKSKLIWSSINTSSCELFAPGTISMAAGTRGSTSTLALATTTRFTLDCSAPSGATTSAQAVVTVQ